MSHSDDETTPVFRQCEHSKNHQTGLPTTQLQNTRQKLAKMERRGGGATQEGDQTMFCMWRVKLNIILFQKYLLHDTHKTHNNTDH